MELKTLLHKLVRGCMNGWISTYECVRCKHTWDVQAEMSYSQFDEKPLGLTAVAKWCPKCGSVYMKWLNYEEKK